MKLKLLLLFLASLLASHSASSREYLPMLKDGKRWMYYYTNHYYELNIYYTLKGDTIIDGKKWFKVYSQSIDQWTGNLLIPEKYTGALLEEDGRVYRIDVNRKEKELVCDFNLEKGARSEPSQDRIWIVTDVSYIYVNGVIRKCLTLTWKDFFDNQNWKEYWVEGIGSNNSLMPASISFMACYEDNHCIFTSKNLTGMPDTKVTPKQDQLVSEGRQWWYRNDDMSVSVYGVDSRMVLKGDTAIAGITWKKLYYIKTPGSVPVYRKALREENGRVYELPDGGQERLLLDFTLGVGDRYTPDGSEDRFLEVVAVDTILSAGIARRRLILQQYVNKVETNLTTWTEGVGSECGIDQPALWSDWGVLYQNGHHTFNYYLLSFYGCADKDGECIYGMIPSNETAITKIPFKPRSKVHSYDLQGRRLMEKPEKGVYIENGKKYLTK